MLGNSLTRDVGLKVGPIVLEVLLKHYFDRVKKDVETPEEAELKQTDVLYHEAFTIVKSFLNASTYHTIEELQAFSNTRTPSSPWTHVVRTLVPLTTCEEAAKYLIIALGGEEEAKKVVGGTKWWQVRGINGVDAQWITAKKDWEEAKRKHKMRQQQKSSGSAPQSNPSIDNTTEGVYDKDMDAMRCILYLHGGGYYFGSVDQERYSIQRFARKINGRVFAINYRLAPQYPFPCALQDALAAYLYLIRPPPGSEHQPVNPKHIIISGDSAGGGLSLALLQVIRDSGLPAVAGGVLISPWCDLTHSFPSIHLNTSTDIIPECGLSFAKPSTLWPPPPPEVASRVHASLRFRIRQTLKLDGSQRRATFIPDADGQFPGTTPVAEHPLAPIKHRDETIVVSLESGETVEVSDQMHFYTTNKLLCHPLVSPAMSYLGDLPPLFFIAGEKEVLRDEIIYTAHKAAYPDKYPITDAARAIYPPFRNLDPSQAKPTSVHLQVYDDTPHILPILFSFTTPAKFCFRAIASFCKLVTEMPLTPSSSSLPKSSTSPGALQTQPTQGIQRSRSLFTSSKSGSAATETSRQPMETILDSPLVSNSPPGSATPIIPLSGPTTSKVSLRRNLSDSIGTIFGSRARAPPSPLDSTIPVPPERPEPPVIDIKKTVRPLPLPPGSRPSIERLEPLRHKSESDVLPAGGAGHAKHQGSGSSDVGGPRFALDAHEGRVPGTRTAGEVSVYDGIKDRRNWECRMIRERVSTQGIIRPLESEDDLVAFKVSPDQMFRIGEDAMTRYLKYRGIFDKRFARTIKSVEKSRKQNLERAKADTVKRLSMIHRVLHRDAHAKNPRLKTAATGKAHGKSNSTTSQRDIDGILASPDWGWAWALDDTEAPPPSSIVSRRDTDEARKLAEIADQAVLSHDEVLSGNNLWSTMVNFLTATPGRHTHVLHKHHEEPGVDTAQDGSTSEAGGVGVAHPGSDDGATADQGPDGKQGGVVASSKPPGATKGKQRVPPMLDPEMSSVTSSDDTHKAASPASVSSPTLARLRRLFGGHGSASTPTLASPTS